jgi:hypothetical protein
MQINLCIYAVIVNNNGKKKYVYAYIKIKQRYEKE